MEPLRIVPGTSNIRECASESSGNSETWDLFHEDEARSKVQTESPEIRPKIPLVIVPFPLSGDAPWLAWNTATNQIHARQVRLDRGLDVVVPSNIRPVLREHGQAVRISLDLPRDFHPGPFESEVESSDSGKA